MVQRHQRRVDADRDLARRGVLVGDAEQLDDVPELAGDVDVGGGDAADALVVDVAGDDRGAERDRGDDRRLGAGMKWPPTGIALAAIVVLGPGVWPGLWLGALLANTLAHEPLAVAAGVATGNTLEAIAGAWMLRRFTDFSPTLERPVHVLGLVRLAALASTTISATIGVTSLCLGEVQPWATYGSLWRVWWLGDVMGDLLVAPVLLTWSSRSRVGRTRDFAEAGMLLAIVVIVSYAVFSWQPGTNRNYPPPLGYAVFPFAIWSALRLGQPVTSLVSFVAASMAVWGTLQGLGPFSDPGRSVTENLTLLQAFMGVLSVTSLVLGAAVADRSRADQELAANEIRKTSVLNAALDCIITMDVEGRVVEFNPAAERTFGYRQTEAVGKLLADLIIPSDLRQSHRAGLERQRETGEHNVLGRRIETRGLRRDGEEFPVELTITRIQGGGGQTLYTGFLRDISDRHRAEETLRKLNAELEERVKQRTSQLEATVEELEAFSYSVSHDLQAPLRSVEGFSRALAEDMGASLPSQAQHQLDRIRAATHRMEELISDLLALSKVSREELTREHIDVSGLATRIASDLQLREPDRSVTLSIAPAMVAQGDARLLRVALENLLDNAWKFTKDRESAHIEVGEISRDGLPGAFYVRDNGAGFDPKYSEKLFGPFQRLHTVVEFPGTGIGLATVRRIVHRHGGRVWAEGQRGQGACFYFTLG